MEKLNYAHFPNCLRLSNRNMELIATTDVGPRVLRLAFLGGENLFCEYPEMLGKTGGNEWRIYGGHRLWTSPEVKPRTYELDNFPVKYEERDGEMVLTPDVDARTGIGKQIRIRLDADRDHVKVVHTLTNHGQWDVELAPWALSVMAPGGRAVVPQEPYASQDDVLLPARPIVVWPYTDMADPRWTWGTKFIQLRQDVKNNKPQKVGVANSLGWAAYTRHEDVFIKRYAFDPKAKYADMGCNTELYTCETMLEVETLGPMVKLAPGASVEHVEEWWLFKAKVGSDDAAIERELLPLVERTSKV
ncbi:MAG: hypothetical protein GC164_11970 [Phycisphaera sp.]|nr:hypothetical protein [Phycisphaera sp.]